MDLSTLDIQDKLTYLSYISHSLFTLKHIYSNENTIQNIVGQSLSTRYHHCYSHHSWLLLPSCALWSVCLGSSHRIWHHDWYRSEVVRQVLSGPRHGTVPVSSWNNQVTVRFGVSNSRQDSSCDWGHGTLPAAISQHHQRVQTIWPLIPIVRQVSRRITNQIGYWKTLYYANHHQQVSRRTGNSLNCQN